MSDSVSFINIVTEEDFVRATRFYYRSRRRMWLSVCAVMGFGIVLVVAGGILSYLIKGLSLKLALTPFLLAVLGGVIWWMWTGHPKRLARKSPAFGIEFDTEFSSSGITSSSPLGAGKMKWAVYTSAHENKDFFIFHSGEGLFYPYPKRNISTPQDVNRLRELIRANVPETKLLA